MTSPRERLGVQITEAHQILEGMTPIQHEVANMMLTARVKGKLTRRAGTAGKYTYRVELGEFPMITIAQNDNEFVGAANLREPQNPDVPLLLYFANLRGGTPENYDLMARVLAEKEIPFKFDYITGIPNTGNLIAKPLARLLGVPYYELLKKPTEGLERQFVVETEDKKDRPLPEEEGLLVDDLITRAATKDAAEDALRAGGYNVAGHAVVLDREEGGVGEMHNAGKKIVAGINATQLFAVALTRGVIREDVYEKIMNNIKREG